MTGAEGSGDLDAGGSRRLSASKMLGLAGAAIAAIASLTTIISWSAGIFSSTPPPVIEAQLLAADVDSVHERLVDYLEETGQSSEGLSRPEAIEEGIRVNVKVRLRGRVGKEIPLTWSVLRDDGARLRGEIYNQTAAVFTPKSEAHSARVPVWIPYPPRAGTYRVRFALTDSERRPLDTRTTDPIRIARVPELQPSPSPASPE